MSDTAVKTAAKEPGMAQLAVILLAISAVCALMLGLVNLITSEPIRLATEEKTQRAMQEVLPAEHDRMVGFHPEFLRLRRAARSRRGQYDQQYAAGLCHCSRSNFRVCIP